MSDTEFHGDGSSLSIEETNKLRISLGLEPLAEEKKLDFVHKPAHNIGDQQKQDKARNKLVKHREERELILKLKEVQPLADDTADFLSFDLLAKKAEDARRKRDMVNSSEDDEEQDENDERPAYTGEDLEGLVVDHSASRFDSYMPTILTLKDANVLDSDRGDVLENVNFADYERYEDNVKNKKLGVHYNPQSDDDEDDLMGAKPSNLLAKYDDKDKKRFVIGSAGTIDRTSEIGDHFMRSNFLGKKVSVTEKEVKIASDYYTAEELNARLRTKRKRKARATRTDTKVATVKIESDLEDIKPKKEEGELEEDNNIKSKRSKGTVDSSVKKERPQTVSSTVAATVESEEDEMDFRPNLVYTELTVLNPKLRQEMSAYKQCKSKMNRLETLLSRQESDDESVSRPTGLVLSTSSDNTDQIFRKLKAQQDSNDARASSVREETIAIPAPVIPIIMKNEIAEIEEQAQSSGWQPEDKIVPTPKLEKKKQVQKPCQSMPVQKKVLKLMDGVLGDDVQLNQGVYSALLLARNKGYLEQEREETKLSNPRSHVLKAQNYYEEKIRYEDIDSKAPRRERYTGPLSSFQDKKDYKPEIKLEYNDEHGRTQEPKEAFRTLSHRFHGKSSGKIKCEKRDSRYRKEVTHSALVGDVAMKSVDKQYSKMKEEKKFCVALSGKNAIIPSSLKRMDKKADKKADKSSPK